MSAGARQTQHRWELNGRYYEHAAFRELILSRRFSPASRSPLAALYLRSYESCERDAFYNKKDTTVYITVKDNSTGSL